MAWPVSGAWETRISEVTTIKKDWGDALDAALNGLYGGTRTIKGMTLDATGYTSVAGATRTIEALGGDLVLKAPVGNAFTFNRTVKANGSLEVTGGIVENTQNIAATLGSMFAGTDMQATRDVIAGRSMTVATGKSSATPGSGQGVALGEVWKDTAPLAWARITAAGGLTRGANISSITRIGSGQYQVDLVNGATTLCAAISLNTVVVGTATTQSVLTQASSTQLLVQTYVVTYNPGGPALSATLTDTSFSLVVFGGG